MRQLRKPIAIAALLGVLAGCAPRMDGLDSDPQGSMKSAIAEGQKRSLVRQQFSESHPSKDQSALAFVDRLRNENFRCQLQYGDRYYAASGADLGKISNVRVPGIECFSAHYRPSICKEFRVSIGLDQSKHQFTLQVIAQQLGATKIQDVHVVCESAALTAAEEAEVAKGIREGYVVPLFP